MAANPKDIRLKEKNDANAQLRAQISELLKQNQALLQQLAESAQREKVLQEQIDFLTKKLFGKSSEKQNHDFPGQLSLFDEAETEQNPALLAKEEEDSITSKEHTRKKKTTYSEKFKGLPSKKVVIPLPEAEQICSVCGEQMEKVGEELVRRELHFIPAKLELIEYYSETWVCPNCKDGLGDTEKPVFAKSNVPPALVGKGYASPSTVAWTMYQKFVNAIPLYRQEKDWLQYGAEISRTTLANWIIYCAQKFFQPMYDYYHRELLKRSFAMADETRVQVLHEEKRRPQTQSFMWLFRSGEDSLPPLILFGYRETRNGDNAAEFLSGFTGYLETDGFQGYNKVPGVIRCACWSHIRRYLIDAIPKGKELDYNQPAVQGVQYCNKLFQLEDIINKKCAGDFEKRKQLRLEKEKPVLEAFWSWLDTQKPVRNSRMAKAVTYINNRREAAMNYLEDGRCSLHNNLSENAIRPFVVGRNNWLFAASPEGAEASAIVYTMVEMAKAHKLNVYQYLKFLLEQRPSADMTDDQLAAFAPWSEKVQAFKIDSSET